MQDEQNLYLLLEYLPGGELFLKVKERAAFTVD